MKFNASKTAIIYEESIAPSKSIEIPTEHDEVVKFIKDSYELKPEGLFMSEIKWKYLIRSVIRGKNIMLIGHSGCGKTVTAQTIQKCLGRPSFYFNLGATQDPRSTLIGNTHFNKEDGTFFSESLFVKAIRTENSIILLDELTRGHQDAWNILMTVLDQKQRYLRLDEKSDSETVHVASGVTFIATANEGAEYTSTKQLDRALKDRFLIIEVDLLTKDEEFNLLKYIYPTVDTSILESIATLADQSRKEVFSDDPEITTIISTRMSIEMAGLIYDGFSLLEAAEVAIMPFFPIEGGTDSERSHLNKLLQQFLSVDSTTMYSTDDLFTKEDLDDAVIP